MVFLSLSFTFSWHAHKYAHACTQVNSAKHDSSQRVADFSVMSRSLCQICLHHITGLSLTHQHTFVAAGSIPEDSSHCLFVPFLCTLPHCCFLFFSLLSVLFFSICKPSLKNNCLYRWSFNHYYNVILKFMQNLYCIKKNAIIYCILRFGLGFEVSNRPPFFLLLSCSFTSCLYPKLGVWWFQMLLSCPHQLPFLPCLDARCHFCLAWCGSGSSVTVTVIWWLRLNKCKPLLGSWWDLCVTLCCPFCLLIFQMRKILRIYI